jgi:hypothetical protein
MLSRTNRWIPLLALATAFLLGREASAQAIWTVKARPAIGKPLINDSTVTCTATVNDANGIPIVVGTGKYVGPQTQVSFSVTDPMITGTTWPVVTLSVQRQATNCNPPQVQSTGDGTTSSSFTMILPCPSLDKGKGKGKDDKKDGK